MPHTKHPRIDRMLDRIEFDVECVRADLADPNVTMAQTVWHGLDLRARLGWALNDAGQSLLRLSTKLCAGCPSSFDKFYDDGYEAGQDQGRRDIVELMVRGDTEVSVVGRLIMDLGMDPKAILNHLEQSEATR